MKKIVFNKALLPCIFFVSALGFFSCKKDNDKATPPEIEILSPAENTVFNMFDTVTVIFNVRDDEALTSVAVSLVDGSNNQVQGSVNATPSSMTTSVTALYVRNEIHLPSGYYYLKVSASDGKSSNYKLRKIYINEAPRKFLGAYLVSSTGPGNVNLFAADTLMNISSAYTYAGDFAAASLSSYNQAFYMAGQTSGNFSSLSLPGHIIGWTVPLIPSANPYFTDVISYQKNVYLAFYDGRIKGYSKTGSIVFNANIAQGFFPTRIARHPDYMLVATKEIISSTRKIVLFNGATGTGFQESFMTQVPKEIFYKDNDNLYFFGNSGTQGVMEIYQISTNGFWTPRTLPAGFLLSAVQIDPDNYLFGMNDGTIYRYQYSITSLTTFVSGIQAGILKYDPVNMVVFAVDGSQIRRYRFPLAQFLGSTNHSASISALELWFNK